jgi:hypothetical protein
MIDLARIVMAERLATGLVMAVIVILSLPELGARLTGRQALFCWDRTIVSLFSMILVPFQFNAVFVEHEIAPTRGIAIANGALLSLGILTVILWSLRAPEEHKRAALACHLAIVTLGLAAGLCI